MAWAPDPAAQRAAEDAQAEAQAAIMARLDAEADRKLTPFERKLLGLIEDVRDAIKDRPAPPVLATLDPDTHHEVVRSIQRALPPGSVVTGPNGPILSVHPLAGTPTVVHNVVDRPAGPIADPNGYLTKLLDAEPADLGRALDAAEMAVAAIYGDATGPTGYRRLAEAALDAALKEAADAEIDRHFETTPGHQSAPTYVAMCPCGARFEVYGEMTDEDRDAAADFDDAHLDCDMTSEVLDEAEGGAAGGDAHPPAEHPAD